VFAYSSFSEIIMTDIIKVLDKGFVRLIDHMGDDFSIVEAARQSTNKGLKNPKEDEEFLRWMLRHGHTSPFEMVEFKFQMKLPVFVARQIIRHRTASVNELSGRYTTSLSEFYEPEDEVFTKTNPTTPAEKITIHSAPNKDDYVEYDLIPEDLLSEWEWKDRFANNFELANQEYEQFVKTGVRKELARIVLPLSTYTQWYWKMDLHNLFHFLELRLSDHAQWETREYAKAVFELIKPIVPIACQAFEDYKLGAVKLNRMEMKALGEVLDIYNSSIVPNNDKINFPKFVHEAADRNIRTEKEKQEFFAKLQKMDQYLKF
jgi:thymidylate synthase (FAD)